MSTLLQNKKIALIGCGDIGNRVAGLLAEQGSDVTGYRRNPDKVSSVIKAKALDVTDADSLKILAEEDFDYVVVSLTPGVSAKVKDQQAVAAAYRATYVEGLKQILAALNIDALKKLIWLSSTSVYAQDDDSWVDEHSVTQPQRTSGQCLLEAEQLLKPLGDKALIIRFAGIYRDGTHRLLTQLQQGKLAATVDTDYYTNRIHVQDCARMIVFLMERAAKQQELQPVYIGCDSSPVQYSQLAAYLSQETGLALNRQLIAKKPAVGSKRCSNAAIKALAFQFIYTDFKLGFAPLIKNMRQ